MMNAGRLQRIGDWARANRFALAIIAPTIIVLLLLTIFRPNLEDRTALIKLNEGWWSARRRAKVATTQS